MQDGASFGGAIKEGTLIFLVPEVEVNLVLKHEANFNQEIYFALQQAIVWRLPHHPAGV